MALMRYLVTESENNSMKKKSKSTNIEQPVRPIDATNTMPNRHTIRIEKAEKGGYSVRHEISGNQGYSEKLHVSPDKKGLKNIINKIV